MKKYRIADGERAESFYISFKAVPSEKIFKGSILLGERVTNSFLSELDGVWGVVGGGGGVVVLVNLCVKVISRGHVSIHHYKLLMPLQHYIRFLAFLVLPKRRRAYSLTSSYVRLSRCPSVTLYSIVRVSATPKVFKIMV